MSKAYRETLFDFTKKRMDVPRKKQRSRPSGFSRANHSGTAPAASTCGAPLVGAGARNACGRWSPSVGSNDEVMCLFLSCVPRTWDFAGFFGVSKKYVRKDRYLLGHDVAMHLCLCKDYWRLQVICHDFFDF